MTNLKPINGFDGYLVDTEGLVYSVWKRTALRERGKYICMSYVKGNPRPLKFYTNKRGYKAVTLRKGGRSYQRLAHRLVALTHLPNPKNKPMACHINGNPSDNALSNLYWGTHSENMLDSIRHGTFQGLFNGGERNGMAKLNLSDVIEIFNNKGVQTKQQLSSLYRVSPHTIGDIWANRRWQKARFEYIRSM